MACRASYILALKRLKILPPSVRRRLFVFTICSAVDYALVLWSHQTTGNLRPALDKIQRLGAQSITGAFKSVKLPILEAEARTAHWSRRHNSQDHQFWIDKYTLPSTNPLARTTTRLFSRFISTLQKIAQEHCNVNVSKCEVIYPYSIPPWHPIPWIGIAEEADMAPKTAEALQAPRSHCCY